MSSLASLESPAQRVAVAQLGIVRDVGTDHEESLRRRTARIASGLGATASLLAMYDLSLLLRAGF